MPTPFTGPAGEHYVLYRLLQKEYVSGLAPENAPNADIIVTNILGTKVAAIQVKTRRPLGTDAGWHMKEKHESLVGGRMFYFFVDLKKDTKESPDMFIVPSRVVAAVLEESHRIWLAQPGRSGQKHKRTIMRRLLPSYSRTLRLNEAQEKRLGNGWLEKYRENWSILGLD